ncbi:MAG: succinate dehydrogenase cytochrome b subunit [Flavobacteriales bacterium]|nr:succinate dehydrogenase cytochrome b subunit [Flavobacteriales bacterium]MCW8913331.1 succinate dehydrogenase cytochrome b subunit [Flavobacteriales bacterium]MCW8936935.1 succinate dehydrogenase cytochrome b subunit [Flavobacteriales bacterium]MCW8940765.1 succinate dehydrogenase cytochrome b subunit [Flavobacteriales bacterium]MCW8990307.1 succinate dehydrogenase cytochrome b subunit [Flavobacteriales bacterium]
MSKGFSTSSVGRKILMALSGFFLLFFLLQHFVINFLSVLSADAFNETSHFMGTNPLIQYILQPVLLFGVLFHLGMGIYLDLQNKKARPVKYAMNKPGENANWMSRNMIITGIMIMLFLGLHFYDFWIPEIKDKFIDGIWDNPTKYYEHLVHKFADPVRVGIYVLAFVFLALHLLHGFQSAFQSVGFNHRKYTPIIKKLGTLYAIIIPLGFIFIAIFHFINHSH